MMITQIAKTDHLPATDQTNRSVREILRLDLKTAIRLEIFLTILYAATLLINEIQKIH